MLFCPPTLSTQLQLAFLLFRRPQVIKGRHVLMACQTQLELIGSLQRQVGSSVVTGLCQAYSPIENSIALASKLLHPHPAPSDPRFVQSTSGHPSISIFLRTVSIRCRTAHCSPPPVRVDYDSTPASRESSVTRKLLPLPPYFYCTR